ncbi:hypothetical protein O0I10_009392 [Lichtheimia ornata]|uniref:Uncharacterized protein n=1 Tax=Lichtheimia ornata TaxID=688661 RepID=A0AAD7XW45_9FUNG|nr:uncharacterized protein O0I10_009392 [Lichtheimia ornata]KAJ8654996.1 hypothetical protein O0I10_009392 [Lichtheimia ornata]
MFLRSLIASSITASSFSCMDNNSHAHSHINKAVVTSIIITSLFRLPHSSSKASSLVTTYSVHHCYLCSLCLYDIWPYYLMDSSLWWHENLGQETRNLNELGWAQIPRITGLVMKREKYKGNSKQRETQELQKDTTTTRDS